MTTQENKPSWRNLREGGFRTPLKRFIGKLERWEVMPNNWGGSDVSFFFGRLEVLATDAPYPHAEGDFSVRLSESKNSAFGILGQSFAEKLGIEVADLDIDNIIGRFFEMERIDDHFFYKDNQTGEDKKGTIWTVLQLVTQPSAASSAAPAATAVAPAPIPASADNKTPTERAMELLHLKNTPDFFRDAVSDELVKSDPALVTSIIDSTFVESAKTRGEVTVDENGVHTVVKFAQSGPY